MVKWEKIEKMLVCGGNFHPPNSDPRPAIVNDASLIALGQILTNILDLITQSNAFQLFYFKI